MFIEKERKLFVYFQIKSLKTSEYIYIDRGDKRDQTINTCRSTVILTNICIRSVTVACTV